VHRRSGLLFVYAMLTMGMSGSVMALRFFMLFFLATITTTAAFGDVHVMWWGARRGSARLARHLWRMCFAMFYWLWRVRGRRTLALAR
jgi:hypothetical protein